MARAQKYNLDYFPHIISSGKKVSYIRKKYGNDGYATWFTILEELGSADFHYLDLRNQGDDDYSIQLMFLSERCNVEEDLLLQIINDVVKLNGFDKQLWENKILWSKDFFDSVQDAWRRRDKKCLTKEDLLDMFTIKKQEPRKKIVNPEKPQKKTEIAQKEKNEIIFPFDTEEFKTKWNHWKTYRKEQHGFSYKSSITEQQALITLSKLAEMNEGVAIDMISQSINDGWKGLFKLKNNNNEKSSSSTKSKSNSQGQGSGNFRTVGDDFVKGIFDEFQSE